jgi:hypothetical protein
LASSTKQLQPPSVPNQGELADAAHTSATPPPEDWAHFTDDWGDTKFDAASISVVVGDLDWVQPRLQSDDAEPANHAQRSVVKRTLFLSLSRVLKLFKSQATPPPSPIVSL